MSLVAGQWTTMGYYLCIWRRGYAYHIRIGTIMRIHIPCIDVIVLESGYVIFSTYDYCGMGCGMWRATRNRSILGYPTITCAFIVYITAMDSVNNSAA